MPQVGERVHAIQRRPAAKERRRPSAELQASRSTGPARTRGSISERVASPVSEIVGGLPTRLRAGVESLTGIAMDDVRVHRNSSEPAKLGALAFTRGTEIHLGPGQEEHLPHEAWHVVQQKQGRVQATTQMKGMVVNDDAGLEREADRMGQIARSGPSRDEQGGLERQTAASTTIQRKVLDGVKPIEEKDKPGPTMLIYVNRPETYLLRSDFHARYAVEPFHLLDISKKYLLGETHGAQADAKFAAELQRWPTAGSMVERKKAFTPVDRADVGIPDEISLHDKSLESVHAFTVLQVIEAISSLSVFRESWVISRWALPGTKPFIQELLRTAAANLLQINAIQQIYSDFINLFQKRPMTSDRSLRIYRFAVRFKDVWIKDAVTLMGHLRSANDAISLHGTRASPSLTELNRRLRKAFAGAQSGIAFLQEIGRAAMEFIDYPAGAEKATISGMLGRAARGLVRDTSPADAARDRGMAENIKLARAPLFVQVGDAHVGELVKLVPDSVAIRHNETLEKVTKKP